MHAAPMPPEQGSNIHHVPPDIIEQILLILPIKSLLRFLSVAKSWNSMIFEPSFIQKHKIRLARDGRKSIVTIVSPFGYLTAADASVCHFSDTSPEHPIAIEDSTDFFCPTEGAPLLLALCDELWLVKAAKSLYLWNHSMRTCWKLPDPKQSCRKAPTLSDILPIGVVYGLTYDSAADDYKVLQIDSEFRSADQLYSVKSNSWRNVRASSRNSKITQYKFEFVNGAFHWISRCRAIARFDLSTEKRGDFPQPNYCGREFSTTEAAVWRGMLCVRANSRGEFVLWAMQKYGEEKSWAKMLDISYSIPSCPQLEPLFLTLRPLCRAGPTMRRTRRSPQAS